MEGALVSAATGALKPVVRELAALMGDEYKRFKRVRKEIGFLTRELSAMEAFLLKMSMEEDPDVQDKAWMKEVRELFYDIEDSLDDFMVNVTDKSAKPNGFMDKIKNLLDKTKARRRIAKEIQDLKKQVVEVADRRARYRTADAISNANSATIDPRALTIFEDVPNLVGVDGPKREIIRLFDVRFFGPYRRPQPKLISIAGFGGLGKTTLANQVYQELKHRFHCHAFVSVSRNPDMVKVLRNILSQVKNGYSSSTEDIPQLITEISNHLANKSYFIVIDDIWNVDVWNAIKCAFPLSRYDDRIITTTRVNVVAQACCSSFDGHVYNMGSLSMVHSKQLFHKRLFNSEKCPPHLEEVSGQILKKCDGSPLAIIAISGLLANKPKTKDQWHQVERSIGHGLERNSSVQGMTKIISLSYFDLPHDLKTCLLYLSIFPEDDVIEKGMLIRSWIAEGLIHKNGKQNLYEAGEMYFNELINRSLIQAANEVYYKGFRGTSSFQPKFYYGEDDEVKACRVHDTILDFIVSKSVEENFVTIVGVPGINLGPQNKVRRLSLQEHGDIPQDLVLSHVRSLYVFGRDVKILSLLEFKHLRVLCIEYSYSLEDHHLADIGNLLHLKCLRLHRVNITKVPEEIANLQYLETLDIDARAAIPAKISRLQRLIHLHVRHCNMPVEISGIEALQVFEATHAFKAGGADKFLQGLSAQCSLRELAIKGSPISLRSLGPLINLQKVKFEISGQDIEQKEVDILGDLPNLRALTVSFNHHEPALSLRNAIRAHPNHPTIVLLALRAEQTTTKMMRNLECMDHRMREEEKMLAASRLASQKYQAARMAEMRAEQSKCAESMRSAGNEAHAISTTFEADASSSTAVASEESRPACSQCRDSDSKSPLCCLIPLQDAMETMTTETVEDDQTSAASSLKSPIVQVLEDELEVERLGAAALREEVDVLKKQA